MEEHADASTSGDHGSVRFIEVGVFLVVLTAASFFASYMDRSNDWEFWSPTTNFLFVMMVALAKASLVILFFMHLKYERAWKYLLTVPPLFLALALVAVLMPDVAFTEYGHKGWAPPGAKAPTKAELPTVPHLPAGPANDPKPAH